MVVRDCMPLLDVSCLTSLLYFVFAGETDVQQEGTATMLASASMASSVNSNSLSGALSGLRGTVIVTNTGLPSTITKSKLTKTKVKLQAGTSEKRGNWL